MEFYEININNNEFTARIQILYKKELTIKISI